MTSSTPLLRPRAAAAGIAARVALVAVVLGVVAGCAVDPVEDPVDGAAGSACPAPSLLLAEGQAPVVRPGDTVVLTAEALMHECHDARVAGEPAPTHEAVLVDVVWSQGGAESTVASVHTNDGSPMSVRFAVPTDAARGAATVIVAHATIELEVSD